MIASLRKRHRWTFAVLALVLPVLFVASLLVRKETPRVADLPAQRELGRVPLLEQPAAPDPLLYWSETEPVVGGPLPADARLLGAIRSQSWLAGDGPTQSAAGGAHFVYSLIDQKVIRIYHASEVPGGAR